MSAARSYNWGNVRLLPSPSRTKACSVGVANATLPLILMRFTKKGALGGKFPAACCSITSPGLLVAGAGGSTGWICCRREPAPGETVGPGVPGAAASTASPDKARSKPASNGLDRANRMDLKCHAPGGSVGRTHQEKVPLCVLPQRDSIECHGHPMVIGSPHPSCR
jgi:hypothetical protein